MNKLKIAVCISGQLRSYNSSQYKIIDAINYLFPEDQYDVDFYGHTWTDQEKPENLSIFKGFIQEDQNNIWEFAKPNLHEYIAYRSEWWDQQEYKDILNNEGNLVGFYKNILKGGLAQVWSHHQCVKQIENVFNYRSIIRCRWDGMLTNLDYYKEPNDHELNYAKDIIHNFISKQPTETMNTFKINALCNHALLTTATANAFIDDHFFVMKPVPGMTYTIEKIINEMSKQHDHNTYPVSHEGWVTYCTVMGINLAAYLPEVLQYNAKGVGPKPNKKWNI